MKRVTVWVLVVLAGLLLVGCSAGTVGDAVSEPDTVAIYAAVIRRLAGPDDTFGGTLDKPILYVIHRTDDASGDPSQAGSDPVTLSDGVQQGISAALADLPSEIVWIDSRDELEFDESGMLPDGGVVITLGNIQPQADGEVHVAGSIYVANLAAGGQTYVLERQDGEWVVTGNTGMEWVS